MQIEDKEERQTAKLALHVIHVQKGIVDYRFLQSNWTKSSNRITLWVGLRKGKWRERQWFPPFEIVLNFLKFRLLPKNRPREWRVGWRFFACVLWSFGRWFDDSGVCLSRARTKTTMKASSTSFTCVSRARGYKDHTSRRDFWIFVAWRQWDFELFQFWGSEATTRKTD